MYALTEKKIRENSSKNGSTKIDEPPAVPETVPTESIAKKAPKNIEKIAKPNHHVLMLLFITQSHTLGLLRLPSIKSSKKGFCQVFGCFHSFYGRSFSLLIRVLDRKNNPKDNAITTAAKIRSRITVTMELSGQRYIWAKLPELQSPFQEADWIPRAVSAAS